MTIWPCPTLLPDALAQLRALLRALDDAGVAQGAALHIQYAADLIGQQLAEEHSLRQPSAAEPD